MLTSRKHLFLWVLLFLSLISMSPSLWAGGHEGHGTQITAYPARPPASTFNVQSKVVPSSGLVAYDTYLTRVPSIARDHISARNESEKSLWDRDLENWRKTTGDKVSRIQNLLGQAKKKNNALTLGVSQALRQMETRYSFARKEEGEKFFGGLIVSHPAHRISQEITDLFLAYSHAFVELSIDEPELSQTEKQKMAYYSAVEQMTKKEVIPEEVLEELSEEHRKDIEELIKLRNHLMEVGNFEAFATEFFKGYQPTFRSPNLIRISRLTNN